MKPKVDGLDRAIYGYLRENPRMPATVIARRIGDVPARTVRARLGRLLEEGIVVISAGVMPEKVGFPIRTDIMIDVEAGKIGQVVDALWDLDEVYYIALSTGDCDVSISTVATDMDALQTFMTETLHAIQGVRKTRVNVLTKILRQSYDWPFPEQV